MEGPLDVGETDSSLSEKSVFQKRHETTLVEGEGIVEQINSRMMKLHFEMIYKGGEQPEEEKLKDFSFEIDNLNGL